MAIYLNRRKRNIELPYIPLLYIQGTGTQYIDTSYKPNGTTRIILDADIHKESGAVYVFGVNEWVQGRYFQLRVVSNATTFLCDYAESAIKTTVAVGFRKTFDMQSNQLRVDGAKKAEWNTTTFQCEGNLKLLAGVTTSGAHRVSAGKIFSCQIYDNGTLIRSYIPVQMRKSKEIGLWDKVNNVFVPNAGSGNFFGVSLVVPNEYIKLKYVESSGTQYIDTNYYPNQDTGVYFEGELVNMTSNIFFGCGKMSEGNMYECYTTEKYVDTYRSYTLDGLSVIDVGTVSIEKRKEKTHIKAANDVIYTHIYGTFTAKKTLTLFARNSSALYKGTARIRLCIITSEDVPVKCFVSVMNKTTKEVGFWETVEQKFYSNAGSGTFIAGEVSG